MSPGPRFLLLLLLGLSLLVGGLLLGLHWFLPDSIAAVSSRPNTDDPFTLGQYYFNHLDDQEGEYNLEKARHYFQTAIAEDPAANQLVWYQLGRIDFLEGSFDQAIYNFEKQIEYFGDSLPNVHYMLGLTYAYQARRYGRIEVWPKAEEEFKKFLTFRPASPWARTDLAWIYFSQGKYEEMLPVLELGLETNPDHPWLLNMYGLALLNTNQKEQAAAHFDRALTAADALTVEDWGKAYPGNDPAVWPEGLAEFRAAIANNLELSEL